MAIEVQLGKLEIKEKGMVPYLNISRSLGKADRREGQVTIEDIRLAAQTICRECPLLPKCEPEHKFRSLAGFPVGVAVIGGKVDLEECLLRSRGLSVEDILHN